MDQRIATNRADDRSIGELFADLSRQMSTLVAQEIGLARAEVTAQIRSVARGAAMIGAGGALAYAGILAVVAAAVLLLIEAGITPWLAALVIGVIVIGIGAALIATGRSEVGSADLTPRRTLETIRDDATVVKEQLK